MLYLWEIPNDWSERLIGEYDRSQSIDRFELRGGRAIDPESRVVIRFRCPRSKLSKLDDLPNSSRIPVVSPRLADVLRAHASDECQLIPARVIASGGDLDDFRVVVATKSVPLLDRDRSEYTLIPGTTAVMGVERLVWREEGLGDLAMARDAERMSSLVVSEDLRSAILELKPKGLALYTPDELDC